MVSYEESLDNYCGASRLVAAISGSMGDPAQPRNLTPGISELGARDAVGKYRIIAKIGSGGMGIVYRARDPEVGRDVAIKTLHANGHRGNEELRTRFRLEARSAGNLKHPNIVTIFDANYRDEIPFIVMEYIEGESLDASIIRQGRLSPSFALSYLRDIASALDYAHERGIIHRDVKPTNVIIDRHGHAQVLDFGVAALALQVAGFEDHAKALKIQGTPGYMAPEQLRGELLSPSVDIFAFGVVAYECLTGRRPFAGRTVAEVVSHTLRGEFTAASLVNPELPQAMDTAFLRILAPRAHERPRSAVAALALIEKAMTDGEFPDQDRGTISFGGRMASQRDPAQSTIASPTEPAARTVEGSPWSTKHPAFAEQFSRPRYEDRNTPGALFRHGEELLAANRSGHHPPRRKLGKGGVMAIVGILALAVCGVVIYERIEVSTDVVAPPLVTDPSEADPPAEARISYQRAAPGTPLSQMSDRELLGELIEGSIQAQLIDVIGEIKKRRPVGSVDALVSVLMREDHAGDVATIKALLRALATIGDPHAAAPIVALLEHGDEGVRLEAAIALDPLANRSEFDFIAYRYVAESSPKVKESLARVLSRVGGIPVTDASITEYLSRHAHAR